MSLKRRTYEIVELAGPGDHVSRAFDIAILLLIALNVAAMIAETVAAIRERYGAALWALEILSVAIFTLEYLLRIWSCTIHPRYRHPLWGRLRFALTPMALIDLFAVLPFYLPFVGVDLRFFRSVRMFRVFRLAKLGRYSTALRLIRDVLTAHKEELAVSLFVMLLLLVTASCLIYYAESEAQPDAFSSIPAAMWWAAATLTTVGYGDVCPITPVGKVLGAVIAVLGVGMFALPTGILGAAFVERIGKRKAASAVCPHCGRSMDGESVA